MLRRFEAAAADPRLIDDGALTVVIVGGGPTGVELAGGLAELFGKVLRKDFPHLDVRRARVVLVEATDRLLGTFAPELSEPGPPHARRSAASRCILGVGVDKVDADAGRT